MSDRKFLGLPFAERTATIKNVKKAGVDFFHRYQKNGLSLIYSIKKESALHDILDAFYNPNMLYAERKFRISRALTFLEQTKCDNREEAIGEENFFDNLIEDARQHKLFPWLVKPLIKFISERKLRDSIGSLVEPPHRPQCTCGRPTTCDNDEWWPYCEVHDKGKR